MIRYKALSQLYGLIFGLKFMAFGDMLRFSPRRLNLIR